VADRLINEASIVDALRETFPVPLLAVVEGQPVPEESLTPGERQLLAPMTAPARRESWLRGRAALKRLASQIGESPDTSTYKFPHPRMSLSHSEPWAIAVGSVSDKLRGVGVDLEVKSAPKPETARKFLNAGELVWLRRLEEDERPKMLHRIWTVKEATFKSDPENAGKSLRDYALADPGFTAGKARRGDQIFQYASFSVAGGFLSVAVLLAVQ
jgi:phosphopantetheinyl transferase